MRTIPAPHRLVKQACTPGTAVASMQHTPMGILERLRRVLVRARRGSSTAVPGGDPSPIRPPETRDPRVPTVGEPTQASLDRALAGATRVRIAGVEELGGGELLTVEDAERIRQLATLLAIVPPTERFHCLCPGDQVLEFLRRERRLAAITLHHGRSIRWNGAWDSDALLADGPALLRWLADRGAPGPLRAWEKDQERAERSRTDWQSWQRAAPTALVPLLPDLASLISPEVPPPELLRAEEVLRAAYPDERDAIVALIDWFGSGAGPWSGFPSYEGVPEALLLRYPAEAIVRALGGEPLTPARAEGAARLFASWWFAHMRPHEAAALPQELALNLREHADRTGDHDKIARLSGALRR